MGAHVGGGLLSRPVNSKWLQRYGNEHYKVATVEQQGWRPQMEDRLCVQMKLCTTRNISYFALFDGHCGDHASLYMAKELHRRLAELRDPLDTRAIEECVVNCDIDFLQNVKSRNHGCTAVFALCRPLSDKEKGRVYPATNDQTMSLRAGAAGSHARNPSVSPHGPGQPGDDPPRKRYQIVVGSVGDSRAIVVTRGGEIRPLTRDHRPDTDVEQARIIAAGGECRYGRVDGELAMSRALGDYVYKQNQTLPYRQQKVVGVPDIRSDVVEEGDCLFLACDGYFEKMNNFQVCSSLSTEMRRAIFDEQGVRQRSRLFREVRRGLAGGTRDKTASPMSSGTGAALTDRQLQPPSAPPSQDPTSRSSTNSFRSSDPALSLARLTDQSLKKGSRDNMSAILVSFEEGSHYHIGSEYVAGALPRGLLSQLDELLFPPAPVAPVLSAADRQREEEERREKEREKEREPSVACVRPDHESKVDAKHNNWSGVGVAPASLTAGAPSPSPPISDVGPTSLSSSYSSMDGPVGFMPPQMPALLDDSDDDDGFCGDSSYRDGLFLAAYIEDARKHGLSPASIRIAARHAHELAAEDGCALCI